jgi:regulation of enolase protein 1 (concanavalin A-like superfamily)
MSSFKLPAIPAELQWKNSPVDWRAAPDGSLAIHAGEKTDWFIDPAGMVTVGNAPVALFAPPDTEFILSANVTVNFGSMFDAGVLFAYVRDDVWAKLCFEYSPQSQPMVVSVVTRGSSDDCNSVVIDKNEVHLRVSKNGPTFAYHYSLDGKSWHMVRYFALGALEGLRVGFSAQSPTGNGCQVTFSDIQYRAGRLADLRSGE